MAATININGVSYSGSTVSVKNGKVVVDGKEVTPGDAKHVTIEVHGDIDSLKVDACEHVAVHGKVGKVSTMSGDVKCGDVSGSVSTMSGDVDCGAIEGGVSSMSGDIRRK